MTQDCLPRSLNFRMVRLTRASLDSGLISQYLVLRMAVLLSINNESFWVCRVGCTGQLPVSHWIRGPDDIAENCWLTGPETFCTTCRHETGKYKKRFDMKLHNEKPRLNSLRKSNRRREYDQRKETRPHLQYSIPASNLESF